ncbi:MAG: hypothetical protein Q9220_005542 [cf. Caloplaca sp. 1 TL-2023]
MGDPTTQEAAPGKKPVQSADYWSKLGLDYERAFGDDPQLVAAVQKWLSHLPSGSHVLECGCGTGIPIARTIADSGHQYKYHGIDIAAGMVDLCKKQIPDGEFEVVDMLAYTPPRVFDGVVSSLSFLELSYFEQVAMARKWMQWLRPGGVFLLSTITAEESRDGYGDQGSGVWDQENGCVKDIPTTFMGNDIMVTLFTQRGWLNLVRGVGLEVVSTETDFFVPKEGPSEPRFYVIARKAVGS